MKRLEFTVYGTPQPQGSSRAFIVGGKARITSANKNLKPFRQQVTQTALEEVRKTVPEGPMFGKHVPVSLIAAFTFRKPATAPAKRRRHVVKPDLDKLIRGICDALTGVAWHDDAQLVQLFSAKHYGDVESVAIEVREVL